MTPTPTGSTGATDADVRAIYEIALAAMKRDEELLNQVSILSSRIAALESARTPVDSMFDRCACGHKRIDHLDDGGSCRYVNGDCGVCDCESFRPAPLAPPPPSGSIAGVVCQCGHKQKSHRGDHNERDCSWCMGCAEFRPVAAPVDPPEAHDAVLIIELPKSLAIRFMDSDRFGSVDLSDMTYISDAIRKGLAAQP